MNTKDDDVLIQGEYYEPVGINDDCSQRTCHGIPIKDGRDGHYNPNAFCKCIDELIEKGKL